MEQRVRICDIAEELGLSTATVSNVIHGKPGKASPETVRRVQALLEERQYIPSMAGILLAQNRSKIFGMVINDHPKYEGHVLEDGFISASVNALSREADRAGYELMFKVTSRWQEIPIFASMWNMAGLVLIGFCDQDFQRLRDEIRIPFVIYDGNIAHGKRLVNLTLDDFDGGRQVGIHFRELGHEHVACISDNDTHVDHRRILGLRSVLPQAELLMVPMEREKRRAFYLARLSTLKRYTAFFAVSDVYAADFLYFARSRGMAVPGDVSVAGFDDSSLSRQLYPALTTVGQDHRRRAALAVELLQKLGRQEPVEPEYPLPVKLIVRDSTGPARKQEKSAWNKKV